MTTKTIYSYLISILLFIGILISGYLLFQHFALQAGQSGGFDLCSAVFGKGCSYALQSSVSSLFGIPLGGWGLIYFFVLCIFFFFSQWLSSSIGDEMIQTAFWISFAGILFSAFYIFMMIRFPVLFCPFCTIFHLVNFTLFVLIKMSTGHSFNQLLRNFGGAFMFVLFSKPSGKPFERWQWLPFVLAIFLGLAILQWVQIEGLSQRITKLAEYDPLKELETYEKRDFHEIPITPDMPVLGPVDAPVILVVFSDFQCSSCAMFAANFEDLIKYNKGKLKICFKYFPLGKSCNPIVKEEIHPLACEAAHAAEAANRQGKFWAYHDSLFIHNQNMKDPAIFIEIARSVGLDMNKFKDDYQSDSCKQIITKNINEGLSLKLDGTPSVFLNGRQVYDLRANKLNFLIKYLTR